MGIYSDVALVMNAKGMECLNAQLEKLDRDMRDDVLEFLDWADEEAESASEWLLCWRDIKWYGDDTIDVLVAILDAMPEAYYKFRRVEETGDTATIWETCTETSTSSPCTGCSGGTRRSCPRRRRTLCDRPSSRLRMWPICSA